MKSPSVSVLLFLSYPFLSAAETRTFWRMEMGAFDGAYRMDPIIAPGAVSRHAHVFHGSSGIGLTADFESLRGANCTSASVLEDMSGYWSVLMLLRSRWFANPQVG